MKFDGRQDAERRRAAEEDVAVRIRLYGGSGFREPEFMFDEFRKTTTIFAVRMDEEFQVVTIEGLHTGKAGDYLAIGIHGELYPIDADVFDASYEPAP